MNNLAELIIALAVNVSLTMWIHYIIEPTRILGSVGLFLDRFYDKETDKYKWFVQWFGCHICLNFWQSLAVAFWLVPIYDFGVGTFNTPLTMLSFAVVSHLIIRKL